MTVLVCTTDRAPPDQLTIPLNLINYLCQIVKTETLRDEVSLPKRRKKRIKRVEKVEEDICKQVTCEICFEEFLFKDMLRSHNKEVHMLGKLRRCSYCDYNTEQTGWGTLKDHIETQHPDSQYIY